jgi:hypothetical protein
VCSKSGSTSFWNETTGAIRLASSAKGAHPSDKESLEEPPEELLPLPPSGTYVGSVDGSMTFDPQVPVLGWQLSPATQVGTGSPSAPIMATWPSHAWAKTRFHRGAQAIGGDDHFEPVVQLRGVCRAALQTAAAPRREPHDGGQTPEHREGPMRRQRLPHLASAPPRANAVKPRHDPRP